MELNLNQYKFIKHTRKDGRTEIIAISTFAGKPVRGKAICDIDDTFSLEDGKRLAAARCNAKIAEKRYARAKKKIYEAEEGVREAGSFYDKMRHYHTDSYSALIEAKRLVENIVSEL